MVSYEIINISKVIETGISSRTVPFVVVFGKKKS